MSIYDFTVKNRAGEDVSLANYKGKVLLIVNTSFDQFDKVKVNGVGAEPLWKYLKKEKGGFVKWNFTKFLVSRDGKIVARFAPTTKPEEFEKDIIKLLEEK